MEFEPDVPWETGARYRYGWAVWIGITAVGIVLNAVVIGFTSCNKNIRLSFVAPAVRYLAIEDLVFVSMCFIQCVVNISGGSFSGTWRACQFQSIYALALFLATGYSLVYYAYVCKNRIKSFKMNVDGEQQCLKFHILSWSWCLLLGVLGTFISKPQLMQSGLLCLVDWRRWYNWITYMGLGVLTIGVMLAVQYREIIKSVKSTQEAVASKSSVAADDSMRSLLIRISLFVTVYVVSATPLLVASLQNIVTGRPSSAELDIVFGIAAHCQSVANPILYFVLHPHHRREVIRTSRKFLRLSARTSSDFWKNSGGSSDESGNNKRGSSGAAADTAAGGSLGEAGLCRTSALDHAHSDLAEVFYLSETAENESKIIEVENAEMLPIVVVDESQSANDSVSSPFRNSSSVQADGRALKAATTSEKRASSKGHNEGAHV